MKKWFILSCIIALGCIPGMNKVNAGNKSLTEGNPRPVQPKLVVGIVIDQMRFDYLYRFYDQYSESGFKRLMREGMNFTFAQYNYIPTYTGPGHASIYTGTTPYYHGIISNSWYSKKTGKSVYCVKDYNYSTVGEEGIAGQASPANLISSTITDQLRMSDNGNSRVFSVSIKDRAAILPGGHMGNQVYWYDGHSGKFITSSYYMKELPEWVKQFNSKRIPEKLMSKPWDTVSNINYRVSWPDAGPGEEDVFKEGKTTFPHTFGKLTESEKLDKIISTPYGLELLNDFVFAMLRENNPGKGPFTDFLAISFSSTDYIGHAYGPNSMEIMDTYIRLDRQIANLLDTLDKRVGAGNYLLFLTGDHGVKPNSAYLKENRISAGGVFPDSIENSLKNFCFRKYGNSGILKNVYESQIYLDHAKIDSMNLDLTQVRRDMANFLKFTFPGIGSILTNVEDDASVPERNMNSFLLNGYNSSRSGDLSLSLSVNNLFLYGDDDEGTSHESSFDYDTHVPMIFYGWHVTPGESNREVYIEDLAPTIANLIHIQEPDATFGIPLIEYKGK